MKGNRLILVLVDGLGYHAAQYMGYMQALTEKGSSGHFRVCSELPSLSRPLYETVLTGVAPLDHGILSNSQKGMSSQEHLFGLCRARGLRTAAAAYYWISELYNRSPFHSVRDIQTREDSLSIQRGAFYCHDSFPDEHLFNEAERLRLEWAPHFLLVHPMNVDDAGHRHGGFHKAYNEAARRVDDLLARSMPRWLSQGWSVVVTADHGMGEEGHHGGNTPEERFVPLWVCHEGFPGGEHTTTSLSQLQIAPLLCHLLGMAPSEKMAPLEWELLQEKDEEE